MGTIHDTMLVRDVVLDDLVVTNERLPHRVEVLLAQARAASVPETEAQIVGVSTLEKPLGWVSRLGLEPRTY